MLSVREACALQLDPGLRAVPAPRQERARTDSGRLSLAMDSDLRSLAAGAEEDSSHARMPGLRIGAAAGLLFAQAPGALRSDSAPPAREDGPEPVPDGRGQGLPAASGARADEDALWRDVQLRLGPVRWQGYLASEYRFQNSAGQRSRGFVDSANLRASSYVFQPWFAQVSGALGFVRSRVTGMSTDASSSASLTGEANLSLFPASRFPFDAGFSVSDTRASGEITGTDFRDTRLRLRQSYQTLEGTRFTARYERSALQSVTFGADVLNVAEAGMSARSGPQSYELNASWSGNSGGAGGTESNLLRVIGRHQYVPAANFQVESLATYNRSLFEQSTATLRSAFSSRFVQLSSFATWRPEEGDPFYDEARPMLVTGALRLSGIASDSSGETSEIQSASAAAGLSYTFNPATRLSANASLTHTGGTGAPGGLSSAQSAALTYAPAPRLLGEYTYVWNLTGQASNSTGADRPGQRSLGGQGGHSLSRSFALAGDSRLTFSIGQSAGAVFATGGATRNLTHNAGVTWSALATSAAQTYVSLHLADTRTFGATRADFQLVNFQATRQQPLSAQSFWTANLTVQGARQRSDAPADGVTPTGAFTFVTSGSVTYQHLRAFGVPGLRLFASYIANDAQFRSRTLGDIDAPREAVSDALEARLEYRIGKLDARLSFRTATVDGRRSSVLFLRLQRNF